MKHETIKKQEDNFDRLCCLLIGGGLGGAIGLGLTMAWKNVCWSFLNPGWIPYPGSGLNFVLFVVIVTISCAVLGLLCLALLTGCFQDGEDHGQSA